MPKWRFHNAKADVIIEADTIQEAWEEWPNTYPDAIQDAVMAEPVKEDDNA